MKLCRCSRVQTETPLPDKKNIKAILGGFLKPLSHKGTEEHLPVSPDYYEVFFFLFASA